MLGKEFKEVFRKKDFLPEQEFLIVDGNNTYTLKINYNYELELYSKENDMEIKVLLPDLSFIRDDLKMYIDDEAEKRAIETLEAISDEVIEQVAKEKYGDDYKIIKTDEEDTKKLEEIESLKDEDLKQELLDYFYYDYLPNKYGYAPEDDAEEYLDYADDDDETNE